MRKLFLLLVCLLVPLVAQAQQVNCAGTGCSSGGSASAGGSNTQVQYNNSTVLNGVSGVTSNGTALAFATGDLLLDGSSTGQTTLNSGLTGSSSNTLTLPTESADTLVDLTGTQTLTNKTLTSPVLNGTITGTALASPPAIGATTPGNGTFNILALSGNVSIASPTTNGFGLNGAATPTYNDTTSSGTVTAETMFSLPAVTFTATTATTFSRLYSLYIPSPTCSTNATCTAIYGIDVEGLSRLNGQIVGNGGATIGGGTMSINASSNQTTNVNTGTSSGTITIGNSTNTGKTNLAGLAGGTAGNGYVCATTSGQTLSYDTSSCGSSLEELKNIAGYIDPKQALAEGLQLRPFWFKFKTDKTHNPDLPGFGAHRTAKVDPRLASWGPKGQLHGVEYAQMVAFEQAEIDALQAEIAELKKHRH